MVGKKVQKTKVQSDYLSDNETSEEEVNLQLYYVAGRKNIQDKKRIHTGYTGSIIT